MTDIVERLRATDRRHPGISHLCHPLELLDEAADEIERLRGDVQVLRLQLSAKETTYVSDEIERLRAALEEIADGFSDPDIRDIARKALKGEP